MTRRRQLRRTAGPKRFRRSSRRSRKSLLLVFALLFGASATRPARAACVEFATPPAISSSALGANSVAAADIDGDGDLDTLSSSRNDSKIAWYENAGAGAGWTIHTISATTTLPTSVTAADVDGDGDLDVLFTSLGVPSLGWYENLAGDGSSWSVHMVFFTGSVGARSALAADIDGDGDLDAIVALSGANSVNWYENDGDGGGWTIHLVSSAASNAYSVFAADVDGDGDVDLLSASTSDNKVAWYENDGAGGGWTIHTVSTTASEAASVFAADLDGDGDLDLLSASFSDNKIASYENDGAGGGWTIHTISVTATTAFSVFAADVDGDGDLDALSGSLNDDKIAWYENDGGGSGWTVHTVSLTALGAFSVVAVDLDGDGDLDVLTANYNGQEIAWYRNDRLHGTALFSGARTVATISPAVTSIATVDLDSDGDLDTVASHFGNDTIEWYENAAPGGDGSIWSRHTVTTGADGASAVAAADVDGDGDSDLFAANFGNGFYWYENTAGDGSAWLTVPILTGSHSANDIVAADLDGDGDVDAVSAWGYTNYVYWHENLAGDGTTWTNHAISSSVGYALVVATADLDGDGDLDVLAAGSSGNLIEWFVNDGSPATGPWTALAISTSVSDPRSIAVADLDGDGDLDVLSASSGDETMAWYENDGSPTVDPETSWLAHSISTTVLGASSVTAADIDGDGDRDVLATAASLTAGVHWWENDGSPATGPWSFHTISTLVSAAYAALAADLDGDGELDVLATGGSATALFWMPNRGTGVFDDGFDSDGDKACWSSSVP